MPAPSSRDIAASRVSLAERPGDAKHGRARSCGSSCLHIGAKPLRCGGGCARPVQRFSERWRNDVASVSPIPRHAVRSDRQACRGQRRREQVEVAASPIATARADARIRHARGVAADAVELPVRRVAIDALSLDAAVVVMAHNHPRGEAWPSRADRDATRRLAERAARARRAAARASGGRAGRSVELPRRGAALDCSVETAPARSPTRPPNGSIIGVAGWGERAGAATGSALLNPASCYSSVVDLGAGSPDRFGEGRKRQARIASGSGRGPSALNMAR
ncbi:radC-like JAB domain-containing protein [Ditylenchus destructor]|uniref:RadC-like JAB domain-containing protein n=1 Tax=Ditylenchus destructor TaxID=166010 RepID=A0AAD4MJY8_9BILA|nr:radC-like JAB domain-containing protein [Ditylenchus destructor]